jgi:ribosomal protein S18 acetylase RimI-like enzyme
MYGEKVSAKILIEQVKKYPYAHFEISDEQLATLLKEQPELVAVDEGAVLVLVPSDSEKNILYWATDSPDNLISADNSEIFVVEVEEHLVGYCGVQLYGFDSEKGAVVWIQALAVAPAYQRRSFGKALLLTGLRWGQRSGAQRSFLAVDKRNHIARKLYEGIGFRPSGEEEINLILSVG